MVNKVSSEKHEGDAICLVYSNKKIFSGGADGKIKIWDSDTNLIKTLDSHDSYIYAITISSSGKIYSSSCDGMVKYMEHPYNIENVNELLQCEDVIQSMYCDGNTLYTGDDKGVVTKWESDKILFKYNLIEEVKSMAAEKDFIYTVRHLDVVISEIMLGKSGKYSTIGVIPGRAPLALVGPLVDGKKSYVAFADRTGKGLILLNNLPSKQFTCTWNLPDCHDMIVNAICGNDKFLYSGGFDGKVKAWTDLGNPKPTLVGEVTVGSCVNSICNGDDDFIYIASSDGRITQAKLA